MVDHISGLLLELNSLIKHFFQIKFRNGAQKLRLKPFKTGHKAGTILLSHALQVANPDYFLIDKICYSVH